MKINISLYNIVFCIASIYGPNVNHPSFFHMSHHSVSDIYTTLIVGGDFSLVNNPDFDEVQHLR